ncbi:MAG: hypothetical protein IJ180_08385 [Bacteroidales bacterium]|nr:hypothetical protein [Bacteroidales bacterium]
MKKQDFVFILCVLVFASLFIFVQPLNSWFMDWSAAKDWRAFVLAFLKFGILATMGECIGLRITQGVYNKKGFGILPRALVWGVLGLCISIAMGIFASGSFGFLNQCGLNISPNTLSQEPFFTRLLYAFTVSVLMNTFFAPVFMTVHKITDTHIQNTGGTLKGFFTPIPAKKIISEMDWSRQWSFVFMKTIPFFWYPAHTLTFMLPGQYRVLCAALLGVALGIILSLANLKKQ